MRTNYRSIFLSLAPLRPDFPLTEASLYVFINGMANKISNSKDEAIKVKEQAFAMLKRSNELRVLIDKRRYWE